MSSDFITRLGGRRRRRGTYRPMSEINVTPFVDVMLVLLIVFMVTAPLLTVGIPVELPKTKAEPLTQPEEPLVITVDREGTIFIQKTEVPLDNLVPRLLAITENNRETRIYLRGDRRVDYGRVVQVLGPVKAAGFTGLALIIDPEDEKAGRAADKDGEDRSG